MQDDRTGRVDGTVIDEYNAMTLPAATVEVVGADTLVHTDLDGNFSIDLAPGTYDLRVSFSDYRTRTVEGVVVAPGDTTTVDIALQLQGMAVEETVLVTATMEPELATQEAQLLERKRAGAIFDNLAAEEMSKSGDSDAAAAMSRVTGVSIVDNEYVYVRGLGERYSNTTLNGAILPTTEPEKRVVPLDLIPTGLIESIQLVKSYLPDRPAEFSGGLVQIESVSAPRRQAWSVSTSQGYNAQSTFDDVLTYAGGGLDWLGFDDGTRALPEVIPDAKLALSGIFDTGRGFTREELEAFGESFANVWEPRTERRSIPDQGWSFSHGNDWGRLGTAVSVSYGLSNRFRTEERRFFRLEETDEGDQGLTVFSDYDFEIAQRTARLGVVGNLSYELGPDHRLSLANFWTHDGSDETRTFEGFNSDIRTEIRNSRLYFVEESIYTSKLAGYHLLTGLGGSRLDWRVSYSRAGRKEPDLREVLYEFDPFRDTFVLADESQSGLRMFNDLADRVWEGGFDLESFFSVAGRPASVKLGPTLTRRTRDFSSRRFRFRPVNNVGVDLSLPPEELFTEENIGPVFLLQEETRPTDTYAAEHTVLGGYAMIDLPVFRDFRVVGGLRIESSDQQVDTFDLFSPDRAPISAALTDTDLLPGVNLVYRLNDDMNLRGSVSRTVNRPEFRELSPFEFTDVVGGRAVVGNPELKRALITSYDLRWEWFPSPTEVIAVSGFYKEFADPIERVIEPTAQLRTSFDNARGATNRGFELELRKRLAGPFDVNVNYTYVDSEVELAQSSNQVQTSLERALSGQSDHVVNAQLGYDDPRRGWQARLLFNFFGERISDVGALGLPNIVEEPRATVDLVLGKRWQQVTLKVSAANLTDAQYEFTQGDRTQRLYTRGREVGFSLSFDGR